MSEKFLVDTDVLIDYLRGDYKRDFFKTHNVGLAGALIAATAKTHNAAIKTLNTKHFPMLKDLEPPYKKEPVQ